MSKRGRPTKQVEEIMVNGEIKTTTTTCPITNIKYIKTFYAKENRWIQSSVEIEYPKDYKDEEIEEVLPKTKQKYLNPNNGKFVSYQRAKQLGLIK